MKQILEIYEHQQYGLATKQIQGLNLFSANGLKVPSTRDPRLIFLQELTSYTPSSCLIGGIGLRDLISEPQEAENYIPDIFQVQSRAGLYEGTFYATGLDDLSCYFPNLSASFWEPDGTDNDNSQYLIECGAIAVYLGIPADKGAVLQQLMVGPPHSLFTPRNPPQHEWMQLTSACCSMVVVAKHDGASLEISSRDKSVFSEIDQSLDVCVKAIEASSWYQKNALVLEWDADKQCLAPTSR